MMIRVSQKLDNVHLDSPQHGRYKQRAPVVTPPLLVDIGPWKKPLYFLSQIFFVNVELPFLTCLFKESLYTPNFPVSFSGNKWKTYLEEFVKILFARAVLDKLSFFNC